MVATGKLKRVAKAHKKHISVSKISNEVTPLENSDGYCVHKHCRDCKNDFTISLTKYNSLNYNCGYLKISNIAELNLCPECHKKYLDNQAKIKSKGLLTDIEIQELAKRRYSATHSWFYHIGFIDGYIEMRDSKKNILSEL
jgi:ribosomal protein L31